MMLSKFIPQVLCLTLLSLVVGISVKGNDNLADSTKCDPEYPYRSIDGSCNNLEHGSWGKAGEKFRRLLPPKYDNDDGVTPRLKSVVEGSPDLSSPRTISTIVHESANVLNNEGTVLVMAWGQFIDHDITHTVGGYNPGTCCSKYDANELHPDVRSGGPCNPIIAKEDDPYFSTEDSRCISFVRSDGMKDDNSTRQQWSDITPFVDASQIYGSNQKVAHGLRAFYDGKMRVKVIRESEFLPDLNDSSQCFKLEEGDYCFLAGDVRVNAFPTLSALHTIFLRYHNLLCDRLKSVHEDWDDEKLYQHARRIVGAIIQKVTFSEYLRILLGFDNAKKYNLLPWDPFYEYSAEINPTLSNEFSTGAFRFGHSQIPDYIDIGKERVYTGKLYMRPKFVLHHLEDLVQGTVKGKTQAVDRLYSSGVTNELFEPPSAPRKGYDLVALNIQRGRDHGLQTYNDYREYCGLPRIMSFEELQSGREAYKQVYKTTDDIDLYSGQLGEVPYNGGMVGELLTCLIGSQFRDLKYGDRFFYENREDPTTAFNDWQIVQLNRFSLSKVICDVTGVSHLQPNLFHPPVGENTPVRCSGYLDLDIEMGYW